MRGPDEPVEPPAQTPAGDERVQFGELTTNWFMADSPLLAKWRNPGGDYIDAAGVSNGATPYATVTASQAKPQLLTWSVGALVAKLLNSNTGIFLHVIGSGVPPAAWSKQGETPPKLRVVAESGHL